MTRINLLFSALVQLYVGAYAQTSLYIPGFDPQPVSAEVAGVDSDGRTTWLLHKGSPTPGFTPTIDFIGTATLVEGPSGAALAYSDPAGGFAIAQECTFSEQTLAICTIFAQGSTVTQTEPVSRIPVQGGESTEVTTTSAPLESETSGSITAAPAPSSNSLPSMVRPKSLEASSTVDEELAEPSESSYATTSGFEAWRLPLVTLALSCLTWMALGCSTVQVRDE